MFMFNRLVHQMEYYSINNDVSRMSRTLPFDEFLGWINQMTQALA